VTPVLVDTSVWSAALRRNGDPALVSRLTQCVEAGSARLHPWVLGELVLGSVSANARGRLEAVAQAPVVPDGAVLTLVDAHALAGGGIGWVDAQLLASAAAADFTLWSLDRSLAAAAERMGRAFRVSDR
jgi:predicted nucleic acid-binding protein